MTDQEKPAVVLAFPHTGDMRAELAGRISDVLIKAHRKVGVLYEKNVPHDCSRNRLVKRFLENEAFSDVPYLLMCDSDIVPPSDILDMALNGKDVCAAAAYIRRDGRNVPVCMYLAEDGLEYEYDPGKMTDGLQQCDAVGTGCIMIHRRVLEAMRDAMKDWPPHKRGWFRFAYDAEGVMVRGEDIDFCEKARDLGFEVWFDNRYHCLHFTTAII